MQSSDFALAPYIPIDNFKMHVPNKIIEYLSEYLPILYSVSGEMDILLKNCGLRYDPSCKNKEFFFENLVSKILYDKYLLRDMSINAEKLFKDEFKAETVYKKFIISHLWLNK